MASPGMFVVATSVICFLSLRVDSTQITNREVSSLLSLLNRKGNNKPVIIILEKESGQALKNKQDQLTSSDEHDTINIPHYLHETFNKNKVIKKSTPSYLNLLQQRLDSLKNRPRSQKNKMIDDKGNAVDKRVLRSPIVKKLLRISNTIQCDAKNDCKNKCQKKYVAKKIYKCQIQCEVKYECDEKEEEEKDPCESGCENSCGNSNECMMSTKGVTLVPDDDQCKRC